MALPNSLGNYTTWDSTDILNRFADGCKPTVADWEAIRPYLFPMKNQTDADAAYAQFKTYYDRYIKQGTVLDADFFLSIFETFIQENNYPFYAKYIDANSPYYANSDLCITTAFANGAKPTGTIFAGYLQALLSPTAFTNNNKCGFALQNINNSSWVQDIVIQGILTMSTTPIVRAHSIANIVYNVIGTPISGEPFTLMFPKHCMCTSHITTVDATLTLICRGQISDIRENSLRQTEIVGLFDNDMRMPTLRTVNSSQFEMEFTIANSHPLFISTAYQPTSIAEGIATVYLITT